VFSKAKLVITILAFTAATGRDSNCPRCYE